MIDRNKVVVRRLVVVELVAEGETVGGRVTCPATHTGDWLGHPPTGHRFDAIDEVSFFRFRDGRMVHSWGIEDNLARLTQLGLRRTAPIAGVSPH